MDSKTAGQPEQASPNQYQLIATISPKLVLCACPADGEVRFLCNVMDTRALLIGPCSHRPRADARSVTLGMSPALHHGA